MKHVEGHFPILRLILRRARSNIARSDFGASRTYSYIKMSEKYFPLNRRMAQYLDPFLESRDKVFSGRYRHLPCLEVSDNSGHDIAELVFRQLSSLFRLYVLLELESAAPRNSERAELSILSTCSFTASLLSRLAGRCIQTETARHRQPVQPLLND